MSTVPSSHTAVVRSVTIRVAGSLITEAFAHHFGTTSQQIGVRAGDTLSYVTTEVAATAIARAFTDGRALAERQQLATVAPPTWLGIEPGTYPPTLLTRYTGAPFCRVGYQPRREISGQVVPAHVWVRIGPVLWQICDLAAARRLEAVWTRCRGLSTGTTTTGHPVEPGSDYESAEPAHPGAATPSAHISATATPIAQRPVPQPPDALPRWGTTPEATCSALAADRRSDRELLAAYADTGEGAALAALVSRHHNTMIAAARRVLGPRGEIEDVAQSAWVSVVVKAATYRGDAAVSTWLYRIAHRQAIDVLRRERGRRADLVGAPDQTENAQGASPAAREATAFEHSDTAAAIDDLMTTLPPTQREAIELVDLQGLTVPEAAAQLGVPEGTVKSRRTRARATMNAAATRRGLDPSQ